MSLLMQALRKAERARTQSGHAPEAEPAAQPVEGGPAFAVMPDAWRLEPLDATALDAAPPVVPAQEAAHDPVPPQARHEPLFAATPPQTQATRQGGSSTLGGGEPGGRADSAVRAGLHAPSPPRAIASSQRRLVILVAALATLLAVFAVVYWRALSGPGPGARLPMVPMPAGAALQGVPPTALQGTSIPVSPNAPALPVAESGAMPQSDAVGLVVGAELQPSISGAAPATRPSADVTIPTPEQLAAIPDPAIRAEAMRDAAERAARQARSEDVLAQSGAAPAPPTQPVRTAAPAHSAPGAPGAAGVAEGAGVAAAPAAKPRRNARVADAPGAARNRTSTTGQITTAVGENGDVRFVRGAAPAGIAPAVQNGYAALKTGDLATARQQYDLALLQDPNNRDALLGAASVALRERDSQQAARNFLRLLELDPNDPEALAGLAELRPAELETNEVKLKGLARRHPESGPVQFALGNLFARQGRWPEAQQSYFRAFSAMPENADYAFNLGVGLDHMNQPRLAQTYYRRALELAQASPPAFNVDAVRKRLQDLETPPR
ncbi:tetratricopeptide repeat protein [Pseudoduganella sp. OTU4001]|uniref:tetratricopeptide repeat protein n=1 Tax=Pseudoduganella sp. OTU4001 TaxID=3043854 RepID=UPI00313B9998